MIFSTVTLTTDADLMRIGKACGTLTGAKLTGAEYTITNALGEAVAMLTWVGVGLTVAAAFVLVVRRKRK